jgi:hypothetical protein
LEVATGKFFLKLKDNKNPNSLINEFEIGLDEHLNFEYYHIWQDTQLHCLSLGHLYFCWKGFPYIDKK